MLMNATAILATVIRGMDLPKLAAPRHMLQMVKLHQDMENQFNTPVTPYCLQIPLVAVSYANLYLYQQAMLPAAVLVDAYLAIVGSRNHLTVIAILQPTTIQETAFLALWLTPSEPEMAQEVAIAHKDTSGKLPPVFLIKPRDTME